MTALLQPELWLCLVFHYLTKLFSHGTDDGHRVVLKSFSDDVDCEHDYINATYIDVRPSKYTVSNYCMGTAPARSIYLYVFDYLILRTVIMLFCCIPIHLTLRVIPKAKSTLPPKVCNLNSKCLLCACNIFVICLCKYECNLIQTLFQLSQSKHSSHFYSVYSNPVRIHKVCKYAEYCSITVELPLIICS